MSTEQTPEEIGYTRTLPTPPAELSREELRVLRAAERGSYPDMSKLSVRNSVSLCRHWNLIRTTSFTLTPLGAKKLAESRAR